MAKMRTTYRHLHLERMYAIDDSAGVIHLLYLSYLGESSGLASLPVRASVIFATMHSKHPTYGEKSCEQRGNCLQWVCFALQATDLQPVSATVHWPTLHKLYKRGVIAS